jgi:hypothetical protein
MILMLRRLAVAALILYLGFAGPGAAQEVPALADVPPIIAAWYPDLSQWHDRLIREHDVLRARFDAHNVQCTSVEQHSSEAEACLASRAKLVVERNLHINETNRFNAEMRQKRGRCVKDFAAELAWKIRDCHRDEPSTWMSTTCFSGTGLTDKSLSCLGALPGGTQGALGAAAAAASCGIATGALLDVLASAPARCKDIANDCLERALRWQREKTAECQMK